MELHDTDICSTCFRSFCSSEKVLVDEHLLKLLTFLVPKINTIALQNTHACDDCLNNIQSACNFKTLYVTNLDKTLAPTPMKEQTDLDLFCICQICKDIIKKSSCASVIKDTIFYVNHYLMKDVDLKAIKNIRVCFSCQKSLLKFHSIMNLLRVYDEINTFKCNDAFYNIGGKLAIKKESLMDYSNMTKEDAIVKSEPIQIENIEKYIKTEVSNNEECLMYEDFSTKNEEVDLKIECEVEESVSTEQMKKFEDTIRISSLNIVSNINYGNNLSIHNSKMTICNDLQIGSENHMPIHENINEIKIFTCDDCGHKTKQKHHLKRHMLIHKNINEIEMFTCDDCGYQSKLKENLKKHLLIHKNINEIELFTCNVCDFKTRHKTALKIHSLIHKNMDEIEIFTCNICNFKTKYRRSLISHKIIHKNIDEIEMFSCTICGHKAKQKGSIRMHMLVHKNVEEIKVFTCTDCDYKTKYKRALQMHTLVHKNINEIEIFTCNICGYKAKLKGNLKRHLLTHKETDETKMFTCDICGYKTKRKADLKRHAFMHKNIDEIKMFACSMCKYKTREKGNLKKHILIHKTVDEIEMFTCDVCGYKARQKSNFKRHLLIHKNTNEVEMFTCDICGYKTKQKGNLKRHTLMH